VNARALAAWSAAGLFIDLFTANPIYKIVVLAAAFCTLAATAGLGRMRRLLAAVTLIATFDALLNFASAHLGTTVLFRLPSGVPALGGPYTLEALAFGIAGGVTIAAAVLAAAPFSLVLTTDAVVDALPRMLSRTGTVIASALNLAPSISASFVEVSEAQRLRGWKPRGPRSWAEIVVPVVLTSVEGSIQLAESMEARGYGSGPRTSVRAAALGRREWALVAASAIAVVLFVAAHVAGTAADWYPYPTLTLPAVDFTSLTACLLLFAPLVTWRSRG
jgi:energy-coupling factor transport system permease protein